MSASLFTEMRKHCFCHDDDTEKIRLDLLAKLLHRSIFNRTDISISCIVDKHVQGAEGFNRRLDSPSCLCFVGDVERNRADSLANPVLQFSQLFRLPRAGYDSIARFQCRQCERATKPPGTPCNQPRL